MQDNRKKGEFIMSAYLCTLIYGNEDFGGYFSVDGEDTRPVEHDMTYQLDPGPHRIEVFSNSNAQRNAGKFQAALYRNTSSSGALLDALERREALKNLGDHWVIDVFVEEGQMVFLHVRSRGDSIVGDPAYEVEDLTEEQVETLEEIFEEQEKEILEEMQRPKRKPKHIVWGIILMAIAAISGYAMLTDYERVTEGYPVWTPYVVIGGFGLGGLLLFINGIRKKSRA